MLRRSFLFALSLNSVATLAQTRRPRLPIPLPQIGGLSDNKIIAGLKEALEIGTGNAVNFTGRLDGFFKNAVIKILMPPKLRTVEKTLRTLGQNALVDEFVMSMNRAAEKAAPEARRFFVGALKEMTFDDARKILFGGQDTAATDYFKGKTALRIGASFKPIISRALEDVGATRKYKEMMGGLTQLPFMRKQSFDLDDYVVGKALDGLFYMVGEEEKKIRKDPLARVTSILQEVFGRK
jgi:hypothetical protein